MDIYVQILAGNRLFLGRYWYRIMVMRHRPYDSRSSRTEALAGSITVPQEEKSTSKTAVLHQAGQSSSPLCLELPERSAKDILSTY